MGVFQDLGIKGAIALTALQGVTGQANPSLDATGFSPDIAPGHTQAGGKRLELAQASTGEPTAIELLYLAEKAKQLEAEKAKANPVVPNPGISSEIPLTAVQAVSLAKYQLYVLSTNTLASTNSTAGTTNSVAISEAGAKITSSTFFATYAEALTNVQAAASNLPVDVQKAAVAGFMSADLLEGKIGAPNMANALRFVGPVGELLGEAATPAKIHNLAIIQSLTTNKVPEAVIQWTVVAASVRTGEVPLVDALKALEQMGATPTPLAVAPAAAPAAPTAVTATTSTPATPTAGVTNALSALDQALVPYFTAISAKAAAAMGKDVGFDAKGHGSVGNFETFVSKLPREVACVATLLTITNQATADDLIAGRPVTLSPQVEKAVRALLNGALSDGQVKDALEELRGFDQQQEWRAKTNAVGALKVLKIPKTKDRDKAAVSAAEVRVEEAERAETQAKDHTNTQAEALGKRGGELLPKLAGVYEDPSVKAVRDGISGSEAAINSASRPTARSTQTEILARDRYPANAALIIETARVYLANASGLRAGFGSVMSSIGADDRPPTPTQIARVRELLGDQYTRANCEAVLFTAHVYTLGLEAGTYVVPKPQIDALSSSVGPAAPAPAAPATTTNTSKTQQVLEQAADFIPFFRKKK